MQLRDCMHKHRLAGTVPGVTVRGLSTTTAPGGRPEADVTTMLL